MKRSAVYSIVNALNGKRYVGSSQDASRRLYDHRYALEHGRHCSPSLQRAWEKYGPGAFSFVILERIEDCAQLLVREQSWIDHYDSANPRRGYNVCSVAGTRRGVPQPASVGEKLRQVHKGKPKSAEHRAMISAARRGYVMPEETKAKLREAAQRQFASRSVREAHAEYARMSSGFKGKRHSAETTAILSAKAKLRSATNIANLPTMTVKVRQKISAALLGKRKGIARHDLRRFSDEQVCEMKALRAGGMTYAAVGSRFGVGRDMAWMVINRLVGNEVVRSETTDMR